MKTIAIFDFDGTICQSFDLIVACLQKKSPTQLDPNHLRTLPSKDVVKAVGLKLVDLPGMILSARKTFKENILTQTIVPTLKESFLELKKKGVSLHIVSSNSEENIEMWLENNGCRDLFDSIYSASTIFGKAKVLKSMMKTNKIDKDSCVYIGDETRDIQAAKEVGLESIAVSWGYNTLDILSTCAPNYLCKVPKDIFELRCFQR